MNARIADLFPATEICIYLNHAAVAPWPQATAVAVQAFAAENAKQGTLNYPQWLTVEQNLRAQAATLLNAHADEIALVKNTSEGLSFVAYGLEWRVGDNIVGIQQEFPSNRFVWQSLAEQGVEFRMLDLTHAPDDPETALLKLCDSNTRLIAVSAVQYANGLRMDLKRIGEFCQRHDILFCVDAIQQLGVIPLDVQAIHADFVVADGHKWLLAPEGLGLFYVRQTHLAQLRLTQYGWHTAESLSDYSVQTYQIAQSARRFECGSPNMLGIHALHASLNVLLTHGIADIWQQVSERIEFLIQGLSAIPEVELLSDTRLERRSGIVSFKLKQGDTDALYQYLQANGVFCAPRGGGIRLSPHFYTPMAQLARVLELVRLAA